MKKENVQDFLDFATHLANLGGNVLTKYWGKLTNIQEKSSSGDLVTEADKESEEVILREIKKRFPSHSILSEETGKSGQETSSFTWIIDPLDGTTNYTHQHPMVSISIALMFENEPIVGVVYNPILKELFKAGKGLGCTLNDLPIHVSKVSELSQSLLATGFAYDRKVAADTNYPEFCHLTHQSQGVRRAGSAALDLAYVAAGRLDGYWERGLSPWDIAAGVLLVEEAGGKVSSYEDTPLVLSTGRILATNGPLHRPLIEELEKVDSGKTKTYY